MEQFNNIHYYQARRNLVLDILESSGKPVTLKQLKELYKQKNAAEMPFSDVSDKAVNDWLVKIDKIGTEMKHNEKVYYIRKPKEAVSSTSTSENKRKTSSPIISSNVKRSRSAPGNEEVTTQNTSLNRQPRSVKFRDQVNYRETPKPRSKSENRPNGMLGAPNMYGSLFIGDDFLLGLAVYKLGFKANKIGRRLQSGYCVSGMTICDATNRINEIEDDRHKSAVIYVGSIDIAAGRELIQIMQDLTELMVACAKKNIRPVLCTLAAMPNYLIGNRKETLEGLNTFICKNPFGIPVIDTNKCFRIDDAVGFSPYYYLESPRPVSGFNRLLLLWSKAGRDKVYEMLMKNLGMALVATGNITFNYI